MERNGFDSVATAPRSSQHRILSSMAAATTTIKVPVQLRDRLAARAKQASVPLAVVIEQALSSIEEQEFWAKVSAENGEVPDTERAGHLINGTLGDDLADDEDDAISAEGAW